MLSPSAVLVKVATGSTGALQWTARQITGTLNRGQAVTAVWSANGIAVALLITSVYLGAVAIKPSADGRLSADVSACEEQKNRVFFMLSALATAGCVGVFLGQRYVPVYFGRA